MIKRFHQHMFFQTLVRSDHFKLSHQVRNWGPRKYFDFLVLE